MWNPCWESNPDYILRRDVFYPLNYRGNMKKCSSCNEVKDDNSFYKKGSSGLTNSMCKACFNAYCVSRWRDRKYKIVQRLGGKCNDCHESYHPNVFDFHHLDPSTKEFDWNRMRLLSDAKLNAELAKCVMLCANCHRIRHIM